jgi:hypothetical protein
MGAGVGALGLQFAASRVFAACRVPLGCRGTPQRPWRVGAGIAGFCARFVRAV